MNLYICERTQTVLCSIAVCIAIVLIIIQFRGCIEHSEKMMTEREKSRYEAGITRSYEKKD